MLIVIELAKFVSSVTLDSIEFVIFELELILSVLFQ